MVPFSDEMLGDLGEVETELRILNSTEVALLEPSSDDELGWWSKMNIDDLSLDFQRPVLKLDLSLATGLFFFLIRKFPDLKKTNPRIQSIWDPIR